MAPDIPAGLGYLTAGLAALGLTVALFINRGRFGNWIIGSYPSWRDSSWQDEHFYAKFTAWIWLPFSLVVLVVALAMLASAIVEFGR